MLKLTRAGFIVVCCAVAIEAAPLAIAAGHKSKAIQITQRVIALSSNGSTVTNVGTSDGKIAGTSVHGALRATATSHAGSTFTATGTLFYPSGTLRYTLNGTIASGPGGSLRFAATGSFTGGTGGYTGAHGNFTGSGSRPANSFETFTIKGTVSYR